MAKISAIGSPPNVGEAFRDTLDWNLCIHETPYETLSRWNFYIPRNHGHDLRMNFTCTTLAWDNMGEIRISIPCAKLLSQTVNHFYIYIMQYRRQELSYRKFLLKKMFWRCRGSFSRQFRLKLMYSWNSVWNNITLKLLHSQESRTRFAHEFYLHYAWVR